MPSLYFTSKFSVNLSYVKVFKYLEFNLSRSLSLKRTEFLENDLILNFSTSCSKLYISSIDKFEPILFR